ncbi:MAG: hypothetical protein HYX89_05465 [Chloroflexi bacterium]|nr:hypothetical protein [Chloroflexota bacterium]
MRLALTLPVSRQVKGSRWCGLHCLEMVYSYYHYDVTAPEIAAGIEMMPSGAYIQELGYHLVTHGFEATLVTRDTSRLPPIYTKLSQEELLADLRRRLAAALAGHKERIYLKGLVKFMELGGQLQVRIPTVEDTIAPALHNGNPLICSIDARALYDWEDPEDRHQQAIGFGGHYVVVTALDDGVVTLNDPSSEFGGVVTYPLSRFLYALYSFQGYVLCPSPR